MSKYDMDSLNGLIDKISFELIDIKDEYKVKEIYNIISELRKRLKDEDDILHDIIQEMEEVRGRI